MSFKLSCFFRQILCVPILLVHNEILYPRRVKKFLRGKKEHSMEEYVEHNMPNEKDKIDAFILETANQLF